ncbi:MAG: response regulator [Cyanobacteria bacterium P01_G01_bin.54]
MAGIAHVYDLILMDVQMSEMNGLEATRRIRQRYPDSPPCIIALTAQSLERDRPDCGSILLWHIQTASPSSPSPFSQKGRRGAGFKVPLPAWERDLG